MELYTVDAFTPHPFGGNPAAVCICDQPLETVMMQQIAREMNLSETAFLIKVEDGYRLRWFTPVVEVKLCGHATLASAHILWETGRLGLGETARFHTLSGVLTASKHGNWIELNFPAKFQEKYEQDITAVASALNIGKEQINGVLKYGEDLLVEVNSETAVREMKPEFDSIFALPFRAVTVTAVSDSGAFDFISRFFAPKVGVKEDPVTGSAHCGLAPYWAEKLGETKLKAFQASERGGELRLEMDGDRVKISGKAVTIMRGNLDTAFLTQFI